MLNRFRCARALALGLVLTTGALAQGYGTVAPYSMQLQALKGQTNTDVYMTFSTSNAAKYPIPAALKKLQVKIRNAAGDVVFLHNEKNLTLSGNKLVSSVAGVNQHNKVEVQAHIKTTQTVNEEIVRGTVIAQLRPDLQVFNVVAPADVKINQPFQVEAVINETNLEVGAVCNVSLYKGNDLFGTVPGVSVPAGGVVSVVFEGVSHPVVESREFSVVISDANPGEFSTANNTRTFTVNFTNPVVAQAMNYGLQYYGYKNYDYYSNSTYGGNTYTYTETAPQMESFGYWAYTSNPSTFPNGNINNVSVKIETEDGVYRQFSANSLTPDYSYNYTYSDPYYGYTYSYNQYPFQVPDSKLTGYVYDYHFTGWGDYYVQYYGPGGYDYSEVGTGMSQWASNRVYTYTYNGQIQYQYTETTPDDWFINADQQLKVSTLLSYANTAFGGGASLEISPYQNQSYSNSGSYWDYYWGLVTYDNHHSYDYTYNYGYGVTDPNILPKAAAGNRLAETQVAPKVFSLAQNYPNPFNPSTTISYTLPEAGDVRLTVFNTMGQEVRVLSAGPEESGEHNVEWDGRDAQGQTVANGLYLYRLQAGDHTAVQKMLLTK